MGDIENNGVRGIRESANSQRAMNPVLFIQ